MTGCIPHRATPLPPPAEVGPLAFDGPQASAGFGRSALQQRLSPLLQPERSEGSPAARELAFRHARQACGGLELHGLVLAPCQLRLDTGAHACLVVPLAGESRLQSITGRRPCLVGAADEGAALMPPGTFQLSSHDWLSVALIPLPPADLLATCLSLAAPSPAADSNQPPGRLQRKLMDQLKRPWQCSGIDPLQRDLLGLLRQTLRALDSGARSRRGDFPPPGWRSDALILQALALLLLEANPAEPGNDASDRERRLDALIAHIAANLHRPLNLTELSARSGWSSRSLQYAFQERFGCGPMQWVRRQRLEAARLALERAQPGEPVRSIAWRCGYTNLSSFSRDILATYGCSPSGLRRQGALDRQ
ncbi:MAG: helix-turn-helix domain-containing protein [Cyanobium sp.]